jgi:hypothetical protein
MEQGFLFWGVGLLSLIAISVLANSMLGIRENVGTSSRTRWPS